MFQLRAVVLMLVLSAPAAAQVEYRNLDGGRPVRVEDATPTERYGLDLDLTTLRFDRLGPGSQRLQLEPRMAYGALANTEISLRVPIFFRERTQSPRAGISGFGLGAMRELRIESLTVPSIAIAGEAFVPAGSNTGNISYSGKLLVTRSFSAIRVHLNGGFGSYSIRVRPPQIADPSCGQPNTQPCVEVPLLPPIDGPCDVSSGQAFPVALACNAASKVLMAGPGGRILTHGHWLVGIATDKAFALRSLLVVADVFAESFEGIGRPVDWTAEIGLRRQLTPWLVVDGAIGRHYAGTSLASFVTFGTSFSRAKIFQRSR